MTRELIIDSFAGGGGASAGIEMALGRSPDIAINHDDVALAMHAANHPATRHLPHNIWKVDPAQACGGEPVALLWASPDCKHFSKAKGGRPVEQGIRDLAWVVVRWARQVRPRVIILENVEEFATWGPLGTNGRPCPRRAGQTFARWLAELRGYGYQVEHRELVAADYGAPTVRKRLFLIARRDGAPIVWPAPTHAKDPLAPRAGRGAARQDGDPEFGRVRGPLRESERLRIVERPPHPDLLPARGEKERALKRWRAAAEIIDWSLPCPSIFDTAEEIIRKHGVRAIRPLAANTLARIARGVQRYVLDAAAPFIVPVKSWGGGGNEARSTDDPLRTTTASKRGEHALVTPFVARTDMHLSNAACAYPIDDPLRTATSSGGHALVTPFLAGLAHGDSRGRREFPLDESITTILAGGGNHALVAPTLINTRNGERQGQDPRCRDIGEPHPTVTAHGSQGALVAAFLAQHNTDMVGHDMREPVSTIVQKGCTQAVVSAGMINLRGTSPDQFAPGDIGAPVNTISAGGIHAAEVRAFLVKYYGAAIGQDAGAPLHAVTGKPHFGLVTVMIAGEPYAIVDIGMRMLTPRELFRAQGFPDDYVIDRTADGAPITKTNQIRMCGNSVCPPVAAALVAANCGDLAAIREAAE